MKKDFVCLSSMDYEVVVYLNMKNVDKEHLLPLVTLITLTKTKLWEARQGVVNSSIKWTEFGVTQLIKEEVEKRFRFEVLKWGLD